MNPGGRVGTQKAKPVGADGFYLDKCNGKWNYFSIFLYGMVTGFLGQSFLNGAG